jgi:hypothetical protein
MHGPCTLVTMVVSVSHMYDYVQCYGWMYLQSSPWVARHPLLQPTLHLGSCRVNLAGLKDLQADNGQ